MTSLKNYWNSSFARGNLKLQIDDWLIKHEPVLEESFETPIIDLGSGLGNNTLFLKEMNYQVISCDISEIALNKLSSIVQGAETRQFDMQEGIPFPDSSIHIIIADLSLHYFSEEETFKILKDIHRVSKSNGVLLCRVNSIKNIPFKGEYFLEVGGIYRRYFDRDQVEHFFQNGLWEIINMDEYAIDRYSKSKNVWEISMRKKHSI